MGAWAATLCEWRGLMTYRFAANQLRKTKVRPLNRAEMERLIEIDEARIAATTNPAESDHG